MKRVGLGRKSLCLTFPAAALVGAEGTCAEDQAHYGGLGFPGWSVPLPNINQIFRTALMSLMETNLQMFQALGSPNGPNLAKYYNLDLSIFIPGVPETQVRKSATLHFIFIFPIGS